MYEVVEFVLAVHESAADVTEINLKQLGYVFDRRTPQPKISARAPQQPQPATELAFGNGALVINWGTYYDRPCVFVSKAKQPGNVGADASREKIPKNELVEGEIVLSFPTIEQARLVENALYGRPLSNAQPAAVPSEPVAWRFKFCGHDKYYFNDMRQISVIGVTNPIESIEPLYTAKSPAVVSGEADKYRELLYAVASKFPNETRHQTALRYIQQAESARNGPSIAAQQNGENR